MRKLGLVRSRGHSRRGFLKSGQVETQLWQVQVIRRERQLPTPHPTPVLPGLPDDFGPDPSSPIPRHPYTLYSRPVPYSFPFRPKDRGTTGLCDRTSRLIEIWYGWSLIHNSLLLGRPRPQTLLRYTSPEESSDDLVHWNSCRV